MQSCLIFCTLYIICYIRIQKPNVIEMKNIKLLAMSAVVGLFFASCTVGPTPVGATSNPLGSKSGKATSTRIFYIFPMRDGGVAEAAKAGGISKVSTVDMKTVNFGLWVNVHTMVTGD